ncbi:hypothetical protein [Roseibium aggregatum]|uniref:Uncharacterized protein n=1 Tax=Roseibium aggregatum TaxID=187304 RepID=A0A926S708_9HYPH|nr:hypothetical protein [Roseibium aggregatum]MBD1547042.1 hypothetical protein [Roseibium aggregatum]
MNVWSLALAVMIVAGAVAGKIVNPGYADHGQTTLSGTPITTLHTPATP